MNFKNIGYYILILSLLILGGSGIYQLFKELIFTSELGIIYKISIIGIIIGIVVLLIGLIIERIRGNKNDNH